MEVSQATYIEGTGDYFANCDWRDVPTINTQVEEHERVIQQLMRQTSDAIIQIGTRMKAVRQLIGKTAFKEWVSQKKWTKTFVSRCIAIANEFEDVPTEITDNFQHTALQILSRENVPQAARNEALEAAGRGEEITKERAENISAEHGVVTRKRKSIQEKLQTLLASIDRFAKDKNPKEIQQIIEALRSKAAEYEETIK